MVGRYPDYDALAEQHHWDEQTRKVVLERLDPPPIRFFSAQETRTLQAFCDVVIAQDAEPRIPVLNYVDDKLQRGLRDGWQYFDQPDDDEVWRRVARGLDDEARTRSSPSYADAPLDDRVEIVHLFSRAQLHGGVWATINVARTWSTVMRYVVGAFYAHPWAWNEIGFGGPAYPRGYSRLGAGLSETWEGEEAFSLDPVEDVARRGLDS